MLVSFLTARTTSWLMLNRRSGAGPNRKLWLKKDVCSKGKASDFYFHDTIDTSIALFVLSGWLTDVELNAALYQSNLIIH